MPNLIADLIVDRVDLVEEGANSAAFIELYKRKEPKSMSIEDILKELKPECAEVIKNKMTEDANALQTAVDKATTLTNELTKAKEDLDKAKADMESMMDPNKKDPNKKDPAKPDDEETMMKSAPEGLRTYVETLKAQKLAAEETLRKQHEQQIESEAVSKAATLKSLPVDQAKLVGIIKTASKEVIEVLTTVNAAIEKGGLKELGSSGQGSTATDPNPHWAKIEAEADKLMKTAGDKITKSKAISEVIKNQPELYRAYVEGGVD